MEAIKKKKIIDGLYQYSMLFLIGCFLGCIFETILCYFQRGYIESRSGLIYGPFNLVYGFGLLVIVLVLKRYKKSYSIFLVGALLGGVVEYICSWIQEVFFHTTSWNYSHYFLNFDGRTSAYHMIWWGILALLFMKHLYPSLMKLIKKIKKGRLAIAIIIIVFFALNSFISAYANCRQYERSKHIKATNAIQVFFDKHYPDERVNKVYPNRRDSVTHEKINKKTSPKGNIQNHHNRKTNKRKQGH